MIAYSPLSAVPAAKDFVDAARNYLATSDNLTSQDVELLISVLEAELQREGTETAISISFQAVGVGFLATLITIGSDVLWLNIVGTVLAGVLVLMGAGRMIGVAIRSDTRRSVLHELYEARRAIALRPWWRRVLG